MQMKASGSKTETKQTSLDPSSPSQSTHTHIHPRTWDERRKEP
jgi:hypothetical protein